MSGTNGKGAIINVDALLSPDITFIIEDENWTIDGDIKARTMLQVQALANKIDKGIVDGDMDASISAFGELHDFLLPLFQYKRPGLKELPWDFPVFLKVVGVIVAKAMGADAMELAAAVTDPPRTTSTPQSPNRSTRRSGSARS